jgi:hypothetical protein
MNLEERFHELREQAGRYAKAAAEKAYLEHFRKSQLAILMKEYEGKGFETAVAQDREARADQRYITTLEGLREATEIAERERWELNIAKMGFEAWRSKQATARAEMELR